MEFIYKHSGIIELCIYNYNTYYILSSLGVIFRGLPGEFKTSPQKNTV